MHAVDTNVLVRLIARDDAHQAALAERFMENGAWVSILALAEVTWVPGTQYKLNPTKLALAIEILLNQKNLVLEDADVVAAAIVLFRMRPAPRLL